jgi:hypothetical protein
MRDALSTQNKCQVAMFDSESCGQIVAFCAILQSNCILWSQLQKHAEKRQLT